MRAPAIPLLLALSMIAAAPAPAQAQESSERRALTWSPEWSRFSTAEYVFTGALAVGLAGAYFGLEAPATGARGGVLFDDPVRDWLRADSESARRAAAQISDVTQGLLIGYPLAVDTALVSWLARGNSDIAWQMFMIDVQSFLLTGAVTLVTKNLTARERPYASSCPVGQSCGSASRNQSFFSGHAAAAFTGAGLICAHHEAMPLYGSPAADLSACLGGLALAATTGVLRIASDDHYATDVLAAAAVGLLSGYLLPRLVHYGSGAPAVDKKKEEAGPSFSIAPVPVLSGDRLGLSVLVVY